MSKVSTRIRVDLTPTRAIGPGKIALLEAVALSAATPSGICSPDRICRQS